MKKLFFVIALILTNAALFSQKDTIKTSYKNLPVKKFYSIMTESVVVNGKTVYKGNGNEITKEKYEEYVKSRNAMQECVPCILETYDENAKLQTKAVQYKDCNVGYYIAFYPNGKVKTIGHYRENESGTWEPLWDNGYCIKHGRWLEYNDKGKIVKTEFYDFGNLKK